MKSRNPYTGCVTEIDVARTIDCTIPDPSKAQGGVLILEYYAGDDIFATSE